MRKNIRIGAYIRSSWGTWDADQIQGKYLTDLMLAFTTLADDHTTLTGVCESWDGWDRIAELKRKNQTLRVIMVVGGWAADGFSQMARDSKKREKFISNCVALIRKKNLDGIDIDWEYPVGRENWYEEGSEESPADEAIKGNPIMVALIDKENYITLLRELREAIRILGMKTGKYYWLSTCAPVADWFTERIDAAAVSSYVDCVKLMAYDYGGPWSEPLYNSNLFPSIQGQWSTSKGVDKLLEAGVPSRKIMLGLANYGRQWQGVPKGDDPNFPGLHQSSNSVDKGMPIGYSQTLVDYLKPDTGFTRYWDDVAKSAYLYNPDLNGGTWISYLDEEQIMHLTQYSKEKELGGMFYWEWYWDQNADLLKVISRFAAEE